MTVITLRRKSAKKKVCKKSAKLKIQKKSAFIGKEKSENQCAEKKPKKMAKNIDIFFQTHPAYQPKSKTKLKQKTRLN